MDIPTPSYYFNQQFEFFVENYNWAKPFSNFFPGIAGTWGVPIWVYYVSRGQAVCSMGVHTKDQAIMEFLSFNKALQAVGTQGFRTFLHLGDENFHEPFKKNLDERCKQKLVVSSHELRIEEMHAGIGIQTSVTYYPIPNSPIPMFVRKLDITNLAAQRRNIQVVDGLARMIPFGVTFEHMKIIPRHIEGMMGVEFMHQIPVFRLKQTPADTEQVGEVNGGYFYFSLNENMEVLYNRWIVDPYPVFHDLENYDQPWGFYAHPLASPNCLDQVLENRTPCAMTALDWELPGESTRTLYSLIGKMSLENDLTRLTHNLNNPEWLQNEREQNQQIIQDIKRTAFTASAKPLFDQYSQQTFLENVMRGGMPVTLQNDSESTHVYVFHRQNGDLERDYHWFILEPTYFSQGNSHYRNILQNRRMDTWFFPQVFDENLASIASLIQLDGYNPLEVSGVRYKPKNTEEILSILGDRYPDPADQELLRNMLDKAFTPGEIAAQIQAHFDLEKREIEGLLAGILANCDALEIGGIHEGFWIDHWTYLLDMIEAIGMIFPDRMGELFIEKKTYTYFDNPDIVAPRAQKTKSTPNGFRQYGAAMRDPEKSELIAGRNEMANRVRTRHGRGEIYTTCLLEKMLCIITNRISSLDARGYGAEMEAGKPGWLDSLNGLPGLFGSSICESLELIRSCRLTLQCLELANIPDGKALTVFRELYVFIQRIGELLASPQRSAFAFWEQSHNALEQYREETRLGIQGEIKNLTCGQVKVFLRGCISRLEDTFQDAPQSDLYHPSGVPYTYFINEVSRCKPGKAPSAGRPMQAGQTPAAFQPRPMALFLEGPVHYLRVFPDKAQEIYRAVKGSSLYDRALKMYRSCESLQNEPLEIGRIKAYANGWLENGSIYTHMAYKWLLEILKSGLYAAFFDELRYVLVPFMAPEQYGRSTLENCSFIASSAFPDTAFHGRAFQPRLSGMTCEFLNIWAVMTAGKAPFRLDEEGRLICMLKPALPDWLFTREEVEIEVPGSYRGGRKIMLPKDSFAFSFLDRTLVIYENPQRKPTAGPGSVSVQEYTLFPTSDGPAQKVPGACLSGQAAHQVRDGAFETMIARLA